MILLIRIFGFEVLHVELSRGDDEPDEDPDPAGGIIQFGLEALEEPAESCLRR